MGMTYTYNLKSYCLNSISDPEPPTPPFWHTIPGTDIRIKFSWVEFYIKDSEEYQAKNLALSVLDKALVKARAALAIHQPIQPRNRDSTRQDGTTFQANLNCIDYFGLTWEMLIDTLEFLKDFVGSYPGWQARLQIHVDRIRSKYALGGINLTYSLGGRGR